ncbi:MAG: HAMP domain-containing histidine kinase [Burkholderiales bacterium]|nr:HAMP domain-containing histidine kinase [Burkholderiales bacterium]
MAEERLPAPAELYEQAPCGLLVADAAGRILHANATLLGWLGYTPEAVRELRIQDLLTIGGRIFHQTHLAPLLRMQGSVAEVKLEMRRSDGEAVPTMLNLAERPWEGSVQLHAAVFMAHDRHKYEQELLAQRRRAEDLAQLAGQMMGIVSHDLRNPLSVVSMSALLLRRMGLDERQEAVVERVARSVETAERLISDLLDFTQARVGGALKMLPKPIDVHAVVGESVGQLAVAFPESCIVHERDGPGDCMADHDRISQAVGNLVANAVRYGRAGAPVTVTTSGRNGRIFVRVHNFGPEIPAEVKPVLFEPMVRGDHSGGVRGIGLGLFIVRHIARAHGGLIEVESSQPQGTAFTLSFPAGALSG